MEIGRHIKKTGITYIYFYFVVVYVFITTIYIVIMNPRTYKFGFGSLKSDFLSDYKQLLSNFNQFVLNLLISGVNLQNMAPSSRDFCLIFYIMFLCSKWIKYIWKTKNKLLGRSPSSLVQCFLNLHLKSAN